MDLSARHQDEHSDGTVVTDPAAIVAALEDSGQQTAILTVRPDPDGPLFDSSLVQIDTQEQRLYLEELRPEYKLQLASGHRLELFVMQRSTVLCCAVTLERTLLEQGRTLYKTHLPEEIHLFQRREIFRVHVPLYDRRDVRILSLDAGEEMVGRIVDLSIKGFCLEIPETDVHPSQIGGIFRYAGMQLPDARNALTGDAAMVNLRPSPCPGFAYAGFNMLDLDPQTERTLMRAALFYQRDARKAGR